MSQYTPLTNPVYPQLFKEFDENPQFQVLYFYFPDDKFGFMEGIGGLERLNKGDGISCVMDHFTFNAKGRYKLVLRAPYTINNHKYILLGFKFPQEEGFGDPNKTCQLAHQCGRHFLGRCYLVKQSCFICNEPSNQLCSGCKAACFCSSTCQALGWRQHKLFCKHIQRTTEEVDTNNEVAVALPTEVDPNQPPIKNLFFSHN